MQATVLHRNPQAEYYTPERCHINELSNSVTDVAVSIAEARVEPGVTTCWHCVRDTVERYVILSGQGRVEVGTLEPTDVGPGAVVLIPANERQRITNTGSDDLVFLAIRSPRFEAHNYQDLE